jgi:hypothetical protein
LGNKKGSVIIKFPHPVKAFWQFRAKLTALAFILTNKNLFPQTLPKN